MYRLIVLLLLASCSTPSPKPVPTTSKPATKPDSIVKKDTLHCITNDSLNDVTNAIAGLPVKGVRLSYLNTDTTFQAYSSELSSAWNQFDTSRLEHLRQFAAKGAMRDDSVQTLFYPFSGPDALYPLVFFPEKKQFILAGLEPLGSLPRFREHHENTTEYFNHLGESLHAILHYSFFRTESMRKDFRQGELNGAIHVLSLFIRRTGNDIVGVRMFALDSSAKEVETQSAGAKLKGLEIEFCHPTLGNRKLIYFSINLANENKRQMQVFYRYVENHSPMATYLKGASYLMHRERYSIVRKFILDHAKAVVQDDSGIDFKHFLTSEHQWVYRIFGTYHKPIKMFGRYYQPALDSLYKAKGAEDLNFGLGYNYRDKNSNLIIARKLRLKS